MEVSFQKEGAVEAEIVSETKAGAEVTAPTPAAAVAPAVPTVIDTTPVAAIPTAPANLAVAPVAPAPVANRHDTTVFDDDNIGFEDIILPRVNIVQKVGDLSNIFPGGEIILNQTLSIHEPANKLTTPPKPGSGLLLFTVIGFRRRQFVEKVEGGKPGMLLNNEEDVRKNNGTLDYNEWKASVVAAKAGQGVALRRFERLATAVCLIEKPAHLQDPDGVSFPFSFEGKQYALALWGMKGVSYTGAAKSMFTARKIGHLKDGYSAQSWGLTTELKDYDGNWAYKPVMSPAGKNSPEFRAFCKSIITG